MENIILANPCASPCFIKPLFDFLVCWPNNANVIASIILDLPAPLWPTNTVTPLSNSNFVSECDKKFESSTDVIIFAFPFCSVHSFQLQSVLLLLVDQLSAMVAVLLLQNLLFSQNQVR